MKLQCNTAYICVMEKKKGATSIRLTPELRKKLERERLKIKPSPSLHAYMLYKLGK